MTLISLTGLALLLSLAPAATAQEHQELGRMWTFENPPLVYLEEEYGFKPDHKWLDSLRLGSLRLGGADALAGFGSASFVSPNGLIMTSTRCLRDSVAATFNDDARRRGRDPLGIIRDGFVAAASQQELRLRSSRDEWLTAAQLISISDVTDDVSEGVAPTDNEVRIKETRDANKQAILDAARKAAPQLVPQIVSLHQGAAFRLYQYKVYDDVRLVCVPHLQAAHFGGASENFAYPRHIIDFAFLRAYEDGKPADTTKHHFKWKPGGAEKDELVFVSGHPGTTSRLATLAQLELERDIRIPMKIEWLTSWLRTFKGMAGADPDNPSWDHGARRSIIELENGLQAARGNLQGLEDAKLMAKKTAAEKAFKDRVMADDALAERYGDLWDRIGSVVQERRLHEAQARFHLPAHPVLYVAVAIVRSCDPAETEERREQANETVESWGTINFAYPWNAFTLDQFVRAHSWLPEDDPFFTKVLGGKSAEELYDLMEGQQARHSPNWLGNPEPREALVRAGWKAIQQSEDPVVVAARELAALMQKNEKRGRELEAKEEALGAEIGRALLACYGTEVGLDGTMTLRFTDGVVRGVPESGTIAPHRTTFSGLYARNAKFRGVHPFDVPEVWLDRKDTIDMTKSINFVSTNDITSGNMVFGTNYLGMHRWRNSDGSSGSVVVNKELEVVGLLVNGNAESLRNDYVFKDDVARAVSVHVDGIMEALVKIYDAHRVAKELTGE